MPRPNTAVDFDAAVQLAIDTAIPGHLGGKLKLQLPTGRTIVVELWPCRGPQVIGGEMADNILQALDEKDGWLTGEQLAEAAGYQFSGAFKRCVRSLVESGHVESGRSGYRRSAPSEPGAGRGL